MIIKRSLLGVIFFFVLLSYAMIPLAVSQNFNQQYSFQFKYGIQDQEFHVSVPTSLYDYYKSLDRTVKKDSDYANFVTPELFISMADQIHTYLGNKTRGDENFANAVLTIIHQIEYGVNETKYPIETIVENAGKCDTMSFLAASIMKAGGLDVVLLYFKGVHHMNIGVHLTYEPYGTWWWQQSVGYDFEGKKYWIAECTPAMDWKVGDVPPLLVNEIPTIIPLKELGDSSGAQVSSKIGLPLNSSSISINLSSSSNFSSSSRLIKISGSITPAYNNETIVLYLSQNGISYETINTKTDINGNYSISWNSTRKGTIYIRTSWWGNTYYSGADSEIIAIFLGTSKSIIQFESPTYYYLYGLPGASSYELENRKGLEDFLKVQFDGTGVVLTGQVMVFSSGQIITIPKNYESIDNFDTTNFSEIFNNRGFSPLRLPNNIEKITNDQFAIILGDYNNNTYALNLKGLDDYDLSLEDGYNEHSSIIINASQFMREEIWYRIEAKISEEKITAIITDEYGYPIEFIEEINNKESNNQKLMLLLTNDLSQIVAFKDLNIEPILETYQDESNQKTIISKISTLYILIATLLIVSLFLGVFLRKRKINK